MIPVKQVIVGHMIHLVLFNMTSSSEKCKQKVLTIDENLKLLVLLN